MPLPLKGQNHNHTGVHGWSFTDCDVDWDFARFGVKIFVAISKVYNTKWKVSHIIGVIIKNCIHLCKIHIYIILCSVFQDEYMYDIKLIHNNQHGRCGKD